MHADYIRIRPKHENDNENTFVWMGQWVQTSMFAPRSIKSILTDDRGGCVDVKKRGRGGKSAIFFTKRGKTICLLWSDKPNIQKHRYTTQACQLFVFLSRVTAEQQSHVN